MVAVSPDGTQPPPSAAAGPRRSAPVHVDALTGLRGLAALEVVLIHSAGRSDYVWLGVEGFGPVCLFVLSGYLLFRQWVPWLLGTGARPGLGTYVRHRVMRIFPAYWLVLAVVALALPVSRPLGTDGWLRAVLLGQTYSPGGLRPGFEQVWSLGTELAWYGVLPLVTLGTALLVRGRSGPVRARLVVGVLLLSVPLTAAWRVWSSASGRETTFTVSFWFPSFALCFCLGAVVATLLGAERAGFLRPRRLVALGSDQVAVLLVAVAAVAVSTSVLGGPDGYVPASFAERQVRFVAATTLALVLLLGCAVATGRGPLVGVLASRPAVAAGRWSYGTYLWHLPVLELMSREAGFPAGPSGLAWRLGLTLAVSLPLAALTYRYVERPLSDWSRGGAPPWRALRRPPSEPAAADPAARTTSASQPSSPAPVHVRSAVPGG